MVAITDKPNSAKVRAGKNPSAMKIARNPCNTDGRLSAPSGRGLRSRGRGLGRLGLVVAHGLDRPDLSPLPHKLTGRVKVLSLSLDTLGLQAGLGLLKVFQGLLLDNHGLETHEMGQSEAIKGEVRWPSVRAGGTLRNSVERLRPTL